jgi:hypothetical protein
MRRFRFGLTAVSSLGFIMAAPAAFAGHCAPGGGQNCNPGVVYNASGAPSFDPLAVNVRQPLQGLRSVHIRTAPTVSITRLYGQQNLASLGDAPSGFTGGCHPTTTQYCRQNMGQPVNLTFQAPVQQPLIAAPLRVAPAPVISPVIAPRVQYGGGYNASAFQPRQYGENTFTPGIAHIPTSYVDRNPATANRLLASGLTQSYHSHSAVSHHTGGIRIAQPSLGHVSGHSQTVSSAASSVAADGTYWEKVSGPTLFGDTLATQVICKRQAPVKPIQPVQIQQQVVRPVIPVAVAQPVYCENTVINSRYGHTGHAQPAPHIQAPYMQAPQIHAPHHNAGHVGWPQAQQGRWNY